MFSVAYTPRTQHDLQHPPSLTTLYILAQLQDTILATAIPPGALAARIDIHPIAAGHVLYRLTPDWVDREQYMGRNRYSLTNAGINALSQWAADMAITARLLDGLFPQPIDEYQLLLSVDNSLLTEGRTWYERSCESLGVWFNVSYDRNRLLLRDLAATRDWQRLHSPQQLERLSQRYPHTWEMQIARWLCYSLHWQETDPLPGRCSLNCCPAAGPARRLTWLQDRFRLVDLSRVPSTTH